MATTPQEVVLVEPTREALRALGFIDDSPEYRAALAIISPLLDAGRCCATVTARSQPIFMCVLPHGHEGECSGVEP
jgi:hypothetical protein